jgi:hypothetical protein
MKVSPGLTLQSRESPQAALVVPSALRAPAPPHFHVSGLLLSSTYAYVTLCKACSTALLCELFCVRVFCMGRVCAFPSTKVCASAGPFWVRALHRARACFLPSAPAAFQGGCVTTFRFCSLFPFGASNIAVEGIATSCARGSLRATRSGVPSLPR